MYLKICEPMIGENRDVEYTLSPCMFFILFSIKGVIFEDTVVLIRSGV